MANYSINPAAARDIVQELVTVTGKLNNSLSTLQAAVQRFIAANNGQAPDAYSGAQSLWNRGQQDMNRALVVGQQRLSDITDNYVNGDNKGAAVFS